MAFSYKVDRRQMIQELVAFDPILKREADEAIHKYYFDPAVKAMQDEFARHPVTKEIQGGIGADNESGTLIGDFREDPEKGDGKPNLFSFIGFDAGDDPTEEIAKRLDPNHPDGPKVVYKGREKDHLTYYFEIRAPDEEAIQNATPLPWAPGISWSKRIEQGLPGVGQFLNTLLRKGSHSGGGIQIDENLRKNKGGATFRPVRYLTQIFKNFLTKAARK